jgi:hypothetical protein
MNAVPQEDFLRGAVNGKKRAFSGSRRAALRRGGGRQSAAIVRLQRLRHQHGKRHRRQGGQRRQRSTEVMRCQAKLAGMRWQTRLVVRRMPDGMHPRRQLGEEENGNEKEMAQRIHSVSLIDLNEQAFEIFTFGEVQGDRMIGRTSQAPDNTCLTTGIHRCPGDDLLEQLQPNTARTGIGHQ